MLRNEEFMTEDKEEEEQEEKEKQGFIAEEGSEFRSFVLARCKPGKGVRDRSGGAGAGSFRFVCIQQGSSKLQRGRVTGFSWPYRHPPVGVIPSESHRRPQRPNRRRCRPDPGKTEGSPGWRFHPQPHPLTRVSLRPWKALSHRRPRRLRPGRASPYRRNGGRRKRQNAGPGRHRPPRR